MYISYYLSVYLKKFGKVIFYTLTFILFWIKGMIFLDPDFGWRLKTGELILKEGIPFKDPFTYSMPSFPFVDHAWIQSLAFSYLYPAIGKLGLAFVYTFFAFIALKIAHSTLASKVKTDLASVYQKSLDKDLGDFSNFIFLLSASLLFVFFGVRVQIVSWVFLALLLKTIFEEDFWEKYKYFIPLLFLVWANLHGGFASGLISFFVVLIVKSFREKRIDFSAYFIFAASVLVTLINPYGFGVWREVWSSISDSNLRWTINEWMPAITMLNLPLIVLGTFSSVFIWKQRKLLKAEEVALFFLFLIQAIGSRRHIPLLVILGLPIATKAVWSFYNELKSQKPALLRLYQAYRWAWLGVLVIILFQLFFDYSEGISLTEENYYPKDAVLFLKENSPSGQIFTEYGWGGYLIWKMPERKVFIDGRMPSWRFIAPEGETNSAFDDYNRILKGELAYKEIFDKYDIQTVLWTKQKEDTPLDVYFEKAENFLTRFGYKKRDFKLLKQLERDGWIKVYQDDLAVIFQKSEE